MKLNKNIKLFINYFLGPLLFIWLSWSIFRQIKNQPGLEQAWLKIKDTASGPMIGSLTVVAVLMLINWSLEALKWKISVSKVQAVSFWKSLQAVFSGVSFSVSTPNRIGEYLGRVLYMDEGNRLKTVSITIAGSISQLIVTLLMGAIGLVILRQQIEAKQLISPIWIQVIIYGVCIVLLFLTLFYFRLSWIIKWVDKLPGISRFVYLVKALEEFNATLLLRLLSLSLLRYLVFMVQYIILFHLFGVDVSVWQAFWTVSVSFLVMAVIPTIAIAELAQRGKVTIAIVGLYSSNELGMTFATAGIWFINLILPAIIGSLLIVRMRKIFRQYNYEDDKT